MAPARTTRSGKASVAGVGQPSQHKQSSRKGKAAWRKNIDLTSTEAALEEMRAQERITGGPLHSTKDSSLFVEDRSGQETPLARRARDKKPLKSLEILSSKSAVPAFTSRSRPQFDLIPGTSEGKAKAQGMSKKQKDRLRRLAGRAGEITGPFNSLVQGVETKVGREQSSAVKAAGSFDVWGEGDRNEVEGRGKGKGRALEDDDDEDDGWNEVVKSKKVKLPRSFGHDSSGGARALPAVPLPHPGTSYNPDLASHEELLLSAYAKEKALDDEETALKAQKAEWEQKRLAVKEMELERYQREGKSARATAPGMELDTPNSDDEDEEDVEAEVRPANGEEDEEDLKSSEPKRKTKQQRAKAARAAEQLAQAKARKQARMERGLLSELPKLRRQYEAAARARIQASEKRRRAKEERRRIKGLEGEKLGKFEVPDQKIDVQTGEELSESLRGLKPEGNLFRDRFQSMQARSLTEPRKRVEARTSRRGIKVYETHAYRRFV
ncbi:P60-like protein [Violaceomyces palustris]|uniref:P60-like protein n=1 Tax=Violaceomyces palustris TaxID=1673888 RepID=A0ACD0P0Z7_9BASI|nr:P60-like protein [Violaceomyces palustris]